MSSKASKHSSLCSLANHSMAAIFCPCKYVAQSGVPHHKHHRKGGAPLQPSYSLDGNVEGTTLSHYHFHFTSIWRWLFSSEPNCRVCSRMNERKSTVQKGDAAFCLLCNRPYCEPHEGEEDDACESNHVSYYRNHPGLRDRIYPSLKARRERLGT